ncbi:MAG: hypothetical protein J5J00_15890 [Deltaproteobacteria bacterium]|nr:hypothetical protein [Deltaproteobacteria bacterium]
MAQKLPLTILSLMLLAAAPTAAQAGEYGSPFTCSSYPSGDDQFLPFTDLQQARVKGARSSPQRHKYTTRHASGPAFVNINTTAVKLALNVA